MKQRPLGPYAIEERLATGGMAEVFVGTRSGPHGFVKRLALKRILPQFSADPDFVAMFVDEARLAARLEHPNIVQVFDFGEDDGRLFLAMELVVGTTVNRMLRAVATVGEAVSLDAALHIASQTAHALAYAHRLCDDDGQPMGIVHRDVSPANILLTKNGHVKLSDFGIARVTGADARTDEGHVRGKLGYMSPEQVMGDELDGRSDVFTLCTVLAEMLIAKPLFGDGNDLDVLVRIRDADLSAIARSRHPIPGDVLRLLQRGLELDPSTRPSAVAFARAVDEVIRRRGIVRGAETLARLLARQDLTRLSPSDHQALESGARPSLLLDTAGVSASTANLIARVGTDTNTSYRVQVTSENREGPVSFDKLVQMVTSGKIDGNTLVSKDASDFSRAADLPELSRFVTSPALLWSSDEVALAARRGDLSAAPLLGVVHRIWSGHDTGALHLFHEGRRKAIYFMEGRPGFVASTDPAELLGEWLVESGTCLRMELDMALAMLPRFGGHLGDALVGLGVLRPVQLFRAISAQVRRRYLEAFRWNQGEWAFVPGVLSHEETFPMGHDAHELMRDAVFETDTGELCAAMAPFHERVMLSNPSPAVSLATYRVPDEWHRLLSVRGDATFAGILAREATLDRVDVDDVFRAFHLGLSCDLLRAA